MNHEQRLWQAEAESLCPHQSSLEARRGLRKDEEMENGRAVTLGLW